LTTEKAPAVYISALLATLSFVIASPVTLTLSGLGLGTAIGLDQARGERVLAELDLALL
jgi:hypothetical protein